MTDKLREWTAHLRTAWIETLSSLRSGVFGTTELRNGRRVDTTIETIVQRKRDLAELNLAIDRHDEELIGGAEHVVRNDVLVGIAHAPRRLTRDEVRRAQVREHRHLHVE